MSPGTARSPAGPAAADKLGDQPRPVLRQPVPDHQQLTGQVAQQLRKTGYDPATRDVSGVFQMYCGDSNEEARQHGGVYTLQYFKFFDALGGRSPHTAKALARYQRRPGSGFTSRSYE